MKSEASRMGLLGRTVIRGRTYPGWLCALAPLYYCALIKVTKQLEQKASAGLVFTKYNNSKSQWTHFREQEEEETRVRRKVMSWIRWVNIVYYTWSFIHHKLLFVTYYMFWDNNHNHNINNRIQWWICTMHFKWSKEDWGVRFSWFEATLK